MSPRVTPENRIPDIAQAAIVVFSRKGFRLTQMEEIAKEAGVSKATLYYYFKSKIHLFHYVLENGIPGDTAPLPSPESAVAASERDLLQFLKKRLRKDTHCASVSRFLKEDASGGDLKRELAEIIEELWDICERNRIQIVILEKSAIEYPELAEIFDRYARRQILDQLERYLTDRMRRGVIRRLHSVSATARFILESLAWFGFKQLGVALEPRYPKSEALPDLISIFLRGLMK